MFSAVSYAVNFPFWHVTSGELWYLVIGVLTGLVAGVHMSQPRYARRG